MCNISFSMSTSGSACDDAALLGTVSESNAYLALQQRLAEQLQAGRAAIALSRIERSFVGVSHYYVPTEISPVLTCSESTPIRAASSTAPGSSDEPASRSTIRQRRAGTGAGGANLKHPAPDSAMHADDGDSDASGSDGAHTSSCIDPVTWFGPSASRLVFTAQAHFRAAAATCLALRDARSALAARVTAGDPSSPRGIQAVIASEGMP